MSCLSCHGHDTNKSIMHRLKCESRRIIHCKSSHAVVGRIKQDLDRNEQDHMMSHRTTVVCGGCKPFLTITVSRR